MLNFANGTVIINNLTIDRYTKKRELKLAKSLTILQYYSVVFGFCNSFEDESLRSRKIVFGDINFHQNYAIY